MSDKFFTDYSEKKTAQASDLFLIHDGNGVKKISKGNFLSDYAENDYLNAGRNLTIVFASEIANYSDPWAWIQARLNANNVNDLRAGDYIPITLTNGQTHDMQIMGICTYTGIFSGAVKTHIDWISRDCYSETQKWNATNINNGDANEAQPFMASALYSWLQNTLLPLLPSAVRSVIASKRLYMPTRYQSGQTLTDDNSWADKSFPGLWLPFEGEVFEHCSWSTVGYGTAAMRQYELFKNSWKAMMKRQGTGGSYCGWWLASAYSGNSTYACGVGAAGVSTNTNASNALGVPVCFRTMAS